MPDNKFIAAHYDGSTYVFLDLGLEGPISEAMSLAAMEYAGTLAGIRALASHGENLDFREAVHLVPQGICVKHGFLPMKDMPQIESIPEDYTAVDAASCLLDRSTIDHILEMMDGYMSAELCKKLKMALLPPCSDVAKSPAGRLALADDGIPATSSGRAALIRTLVSAWHGRAIPHTANRLLLRWYIDNQDVEEWETGEESEE